MSDDSRLRKDDPEQKPTDSGQEAIPEKAAGESETSKDSQGQETVWEEVDESALPGEYTRERSDIDQKAANAIDTDYGKRIRAGVIVLLVTFVGFGGWAALAPLDGAAVAPGQVVVDSQNRVVQHLEGGIIAGLYISDGDQVEQGQPIIELSDTQARSELDIVESQLWETLGREARLRAERIGAEEITFPDLLLERQDQTEIGHILEGQKSLFESRTEAQEGQISIYKQRIGALTQQMQGLRALNSNLQSRINSFRRELRDWQELFEQELADRTRINEMERELYRLEGEKASNESQLAELEIKIGETRSELLVTRQNYAEEVSEQLREAQQQLADLKARQVALKDTLDRTTIIAPATGTVVGLKVHTVGGIVQPGDTLLEVVPEDQEYTIKSRVQTQDIDRVAIGQMADVRLSAFNQQLADVVEGRVVRLSADAFEDEQNGEMYYEARVAITESGQQVMDQQGMYLVPGMPAEVMIRTGERTLLQYLLDPVTRMFEKAMREE